MTTVLRAVENAVCTLTLNRPDRLNAINAAMIAELNAALADANADDAVRAIVLRGAGRAFCSGDDLKEFDQQSRSEAVARRYIEDLQEVTRRIVHGDKIVVGAVHGWAAGGGFEWAIDCDLLLMAEGTRCFFPETGWGMAVTGGVTALLPRIIGAQRARALILLGEKIDAREALAMGLAWRVVPEDALFDEAQALAERIAALPARAARDVKRILDRACTATVKQAIALETEATVRSFTDPETAARVAGFKT